jgi:heptosyltransferase-2
LVCRLSALGDIVLSIPVFETLRRAYPSAHLALLSREPFGRIARALATLDEVLLWSGPGANLPPLAREREWDLVVDLSATGRSRRLLRAVRARRVLRARKETLRRFARVKLRAFGAGKLDISKAADRLHAALAPLGLRERTCVPRFTLPPPPAGGPVLVAPGGGRAAKKWPEERFIEVSRHLVERGERVLLVGSQEERDLLERIRSALPHGCAEAHSGLSLEELPEIVARCPVALTNDSALLHVAEACGAKVVALFGPTHPSLGFGPLSPDSIALHTGISCSPCDLHGPPVCPRKHHRCLRELSVERVLSEVLCRLSKDPRS